MPEKEQDARRYYTWGEFKAMVEAQGIDEATIMVWIDWHGCGGVIIKDRDIGVTVQGD